MNKSILSIAALSCLASSMQAQQKAAAQRPNIVYIMCDDGKLTGRYVGEIVDGQRKAELLKLIAQVEKVNLAQTIAVGDGANDLPMLGEAGLGIAFHAKPRVVANAKQSINTIGIDGVLYFLGFKDSYLGEQGRF